MPHLVIQYTDNLEADAQLATLTRSDVRIAQEVTLLDLLDRLLGGGVVIHGEVTLAVANVDLVHLSLRAVVAAVESLGRETGQTLPTAGAG